MSDNDTSKAEEESEEEVKPEAAAAPAPEQEELELGAEAPAAQAEAKIEADADSEAASAGADAEADKEAPASEAVAKEAVKAEEPKEAVKAEEKAAEAKEETAELGLSGENPVDESAADKKVYSREASSDSPDLVKKAEEKLKEFEKDEDEELIEKVVFINRCAKVVKGGRRFSFSALVVCGDQNGKVGYGFGKANEVADCIRKGSEMSKNSMVAVSLKDNTIPHEVIGEFGGGRVMLRPASPGTGIIAGGGVRAVVEAAGIKDVLAKSMGSNNHANVVKATLKALMSLRTREQIYKLRGKKVREKAAL
jgi:small subunit ribosomal protein S5